MKVLITGGLGFIGSRLAEKCIAEGHDVTVIDSLDPHAGGNKYNIASIANDIIHIRADITDLSACREAVKGKDWIFHCAALTSHLGSMQDPVGNVRVNCLGTINMLEAVRDEAGDAHFINVGTSTQTGPMRSELIDELHPEFPTDVYSANKAAAENYTLIYGHAYGLKTTSVRLSNVFGPNAHIKSAAFGFINFFVGLALQGKPITVFGDGSQLRNTSYVDDCVDALRSVAGKEATFGEAFFATADEHWSVAEIANNIVECMGGELRLVPWPPERKAIDVGNILISNKKLKAVTAWAPKTTLKAGLALTRDFYLSRLSWYL